MIKFPFCNIRGFIGHLFEKEDATWTPRYQSFSLDQDHLAQIWIGHSFIPVICEIKSVYYKGLTLSVEQVYLIFVSIEEALWWEILLCAVYFLLNQFAIYISDKSSGFDVVDEMVVGQRGIMEKGDKY